jgi:hypothetical protein
MGRAMMARSAGRTFAGAVPLQTRKCERDQSHFNFLRSMLGSIEKLKTYQICSRGPLGCRSSILIAGVATNKKTDSP